MGSRVVGISTANASLSNASSPGASVRIVRPHADFLLIGAFGAGLLLISRKYSEDCERSSGCLSSLELAELVLLCERWGGVRGGVGASDRASSSVAGVRWLDMETL